MKKLLSILLFSLLSLISQADFEGLPLATTNYTWASTRNIGVISQLWESVQERCYILSDKISPLSIVENWAIQDGYSNYVWDSTWTVGTNTYTKVMTNRYAHYTTITTTNQIGPYTFAISNSPYASWFVPFSTNYSATTNITIDLPVTHAFMSTLDNKIFEMTPYFVNTNFAINGNYNAWFNGDFSNPIEIIEHHTWFPYQYVQIPYESWTGATKRNYLVRVVGPWDAGVFTKYFGYPSGDLGSLWDDDLDTYIRYVSTFYRYELPTNFPMLSVAGVMKNANIGYTTNLIYDCHTNIIGGQAYFTRVPANTNTWILWEADCVKRDTITLSGSGLDEIFGYSYDGLYVKYTLQELHDMGWTDVSPDLLYGLYYNFPWANKNPYVYMRGNLVYGEDFAVLFEERESYCDTWQFVHGPRVMPTYPSSVFAKSGPISFKLGNSFEYEPMYDMWLPLDATSPLISSNTWRTDGTYAWVYDFFPYIPTTNDVPPQPSALKVGCTTTLGYTNQWLQKSIANYDTRFYDPSTKPYWKLLCTTNVSISLSAKGWKYVLGTPDSLGLQAVVPVTENVTLTTTNTPSPNQWYDVNPTSTIVTGWAPFNTSILLLWTNSHSYQYMPYRMYAEDINERVKYMQQLLWTTHDSFDWINHQKQDYSGSWIEEGNWSGTPKEPVTATKYEPDLDACNAALPPDPNYRTFEKYFTYGPITWVPAETYSGYIYSNELAWTNALYPLGGDIMQGQPWLGWNSTNAWLNFIFHENWDPSSYYADDQYFNWDVWITEWMYSEGTTVSNSFSPIVSTSEPTSIASKSMHHTREQVTDYFTKYYNLDPDIYLPWHSYFRLFYPWYNEAKGEIVADPRAVKLPYSDIIRGQTWDGTITKATLIITNMPQTNMYCQTIYRDLSVYIKTNVDGNEAPYKYKTNLYTCSMFEEIGEFYSDPFFQADNTIPTFTMSLSQNRYPVHDSIPYYDYVYTNLNQYIIKTNWGHYTDSIQTTNDICFTQRCVISRYSYKAGFPDIIVFEGYTDHWNGAGKALKGWILDNPPADPLYGEWTPDPRVKVYPIGRFSPTGWVNTAWTNLPLITPPFDTPGLDGYIEVVTNIATYSLTNITEVVSNITWISSYTDPRLDYNTPWPNTQMESNSLLYITTSPPYNPDTKWYYTNTLDVCKTNIYWVGIEWDTNTNDLVYTEVAVRDYYHWALSLTQNLDTNTTMSIHTDKQLLKWNVTNGLKRK